MKLADDEFDRIVQKAISRIPTDIKDHLDNLVISVRKRPTRAILRAMDMPSGEALLGVFQGVPLTEQMVTSPPLFPNTIILFQEPLEKTSGSAEELADQIEITVVHEVAHFLGMSEEELVELGYG